MPNGETTIGEELIRPTELYVKPIVALFEKEYEINGLAHITGGGFTNLIRLKKGVVYEINDLPETPEIFKLIYEQNVDIKEMYRVFNMGVGFVVICDEKEAEKIMATWDHYLMYLRKSRQDDPNETVEEVLAKHETRLQEYALREFGVAPIYRTKFIRFLDKE